MEEDGFSDQVPCQTGLLSLHESLFVWSSALIVCYACRGQGWSDAGIFSVLEFNLVVAVALLLGFSALQSRPGNFAFFQPRADPRNKASKLALKGENHCRWASLKFVLQAWRRREHPENFADTCNG